ncbi:MAG: tRNA (adenosine(37)-N6)-threonylcarbamoyltransferase complex dimerization subunit type 1 TsaB [Snowella sp.]|nr:tRNA (adenosine(37)-N6)-threonylcarbamoyltransferase complex dimerization subunit type 1 TsaB [Snowella sp.]
MQYGLALHTTSSQLGLAISNFSGDHHAQTWDLGRDLSNLLHQYLADFIQPQSWDAIAFIAVANGPGSFTSTRIGMVTARTLGQQLNIPVFSLSSLAVFVWSLRSPEIINQPIPLQLKATQDQVYGAIYQITEQEQLLTLMPDTLLEPEQWQEKLTYFAPNHSPIIVSDQLGNTASDLLDLAHREWQAGKRPVWTEALPFYG